MFSVVLMAALTTSVDLPDRRGGCCGCYGGCHGRRHGCHGCYGGCYGCYGCYGGCYGYGYGYGCCGCYGGVAYYGGCYGCYGGGMIMPGTTIQPSGEKIQKKPSEKRSMLPAPATIVVELPADAKLFIENEQTSATGASRVFQSPVLNPGKEYHYTLKAEVVRDGKPIRAEQVVTVKPGETTPVTLTMPAIGIAQR